MKLIITRGLPGSGKSTWAEAQVVANPQMVRVNRDSLRAMMNGTRNNAKTEKLIANARDALIRTTLSTGRSVIVDDTNLVPSTVERLREIAQEFKASFEVQDFTDVPVQVCIERDLHRERSVGSKVIMRMYRDFLAPKPAEYNPDPALPSAVICDIDGTLAFNVERSIYDYSKVSTDVPNEPIISLVRMLATQHEIIFTSGREDVCEADTRAWLAKYVVDTDPDQIKLFMRPANDKRRDAIVKREIFDAHIRDQYRVVYVVDDRNQVVEMWRQLGLTVLQVADGDF
ncbi:AAA family ATPase [Ferrimicrobium acidiphilum]|uniref:phosphatase domain-containing protein n=1 Tax=Ferrimicrobium acidiphilum TaxID=121039 RepID=UPI0023F427A0|nr:AAA family ATPase [Ferrimicrobium acidiphilum]